MIDEFRSHSESSDDFSWPDESRIRALLEEILETGSGPEQVSGGDPKLERVLRHRLRRAREVEAQLEALFPSQHSGEDSTRRALLEDPRADARLPEIPGYEFHGVIGTGGMGVVYRARHLKLDRLVAIKMVLLGAYASGAQLESLLREARDVAGLRHPNIVQVYDVGEHDGFPYFAMEFLDGGDLARTLQGKPRAAREAANLIRVLAGAVHAAHLGGIVHRDLKPGNIFLCSDGTPKVGDFSLASRPGHDPTIMTHARQGGTPSYMAPEQATGDSRAIRPAVDIYALGAILYELLTGRPPFKAESSTETRRQVVTDEPVPPTRLNSRVPRDLETICLKCLQKDPVRRYKTAAELADDLERFANGEPILARPVSSVEKVVKWSRRRPSTTLAIAVSVVALAGAVSGGIWLQQVRDARHTAEVVRRESARASIETALPSLSRLVKSKEWVDAVGVLRTAQAQLPDAQSPDLGDRLAAIEEAFEVSQELERVRENLVGSDSTGYTLSPARESYSSIFSRVGIGGDIEIEIASGRVRESLIREELLVALDLAAYAEHSGGNFTERDRLLAVARAASPNPWQDRFRDPNGWQAARFRELLEDLPLADPPPPSHQVFLIAANLATLGAGESAIEILREAQSRDPSDAWFTLGLADALRRDQDLVGALQFYRSATALQPNNFAIWNVLGWTLTASGNPEEAIAPLRKALSLRPGHPLSTWYLINALALSNRWDEALAVAQEFSAAYPDIELPVYTNSHFLFYSARSAAAGREWATAAELYAQIPLEQSNNSHVRFESAAVALLSGDIERYRQAYASMREQHEIASLRAYLVARACTLAPTSAQELAHASALAMPELQQYADSRWSLIQQAALLCRGGSPGEAIPLLKESLQQSQRPGSGVVAWVWLARAYLSLEDHDASKIWLGKAVEWMDQGNTMPEDIHLHDWLEAQLLRHEVEAELAL